MTSGIEYWNQPSPAWEQAREGEEKESMMARFVVRRGERSAEGEGPRGGLA